MFCNYDDNIMKLEYIDVTHLMSWDEKELTEQIENYFKNVSKEQFLIDLKKAKCLHLVEDVTLDGVENK